MAIEGSCSGARQVRPLPRWLERGLPSLLRVRSPVNVVDTEGMLRTPIALSVLVLALAGCGADDKPAPEPSATITPFPNVETPQPLQTAYDLCLDVDTPGTMEYDPEAKYLAVNLKPEGNRATLLCVTDHLRTPEEMVDRIEAADESTATDTDDRGLVYTWTDQDGLRLTISDERQVG